MTKVKLLRDLTKYNIMGYDTKVLTAKKDEVVEITGMRASKLIKDALAIEVLKEEPQKVLEENTIHSDKLSSKGSDVVTTDVLDDDYFTLDAKTITHLRGLGKDKIEAILRSYSFEVDKRHTLSAIQEELIETVSISLPKGIATVEDLIKFYNDEFGILLDKANYSEDKLSGLTADMGALLKGALSDEDS